MAKKEEKEWIELTKPLSQKHQPNGANSQLVTMTGTVTHGYQTGQTVEVMMELTDSELKRLTSKEDHATSRQCRCGARQGLHIILLSVVCFPVAFIVSACMAFYLGSLTWYNIYLYFSEEKTIWHKVSLCPLLILTFPFSVGLSAVGVAMYAAVVQVSWWFSSWRKEFADFEKGFYGWLCNSLRLAECSPYETVILNETDEEILHTSRS
ncbi:transmembrane protein 169-like [Haliotis rubra]|uniref:transmembrane protein 169-like n=1 Tax=Haliotis rubra TaxID=36100 RepID=UPI001EE61113|nr:transmembrane protein 169-like [Haliotis rubra]XP_046570271.1 transmembrane protein 169-like [Haliotis rubra]XP_046570272.1 transmembrane protein 169-like [Haliotis rubra]